MNEEINDTIAIIVPVYNCEKYLKNCINSILRQTYKNWTLILVNDGSTDKSGIICDRAATTDDRIRVLHQINQGANQARINGIKMALSNDYITFVDSDDYADKNYLEVLYKKIVETDADVVCSNLTRINRFNLKFKTYSPPLLEKERVFVKGTDNWNVLMHSFFGVSSFSGYLHTKLYKTKCFKNIDFFSYPCHFFQEDIALNLQIFLNCQKIVALPNRLYFYRMGGGTSRFMPSFITDCISLYDFKNVIIDKQDFPEVYKYTTAVELKNELMTWFDMFYSGTNCDTTKLMDEIDRCCSISQVVEAVNYPKEDTSGVQNFRMLVQKKNTKEITKLVIKRYKKNLVKKWLKNILM